MIRVFALVLVAGMWASIVGCGHSPTINSKTYLREAFGQWEPIGNQLYATVDNTLFYALSGGGTSKSVIFEASFSPTAGFSGLDRLNISISALSLKLGFESSAVAFELTGTSRSIEKNQSIQFYYAPVYEVYKITGHIDGKELDGLYQHPKKGEAWAWVIYDAQGHKLIDTRESDPPVPMTTSPSTVPTTASTAAPSTVRSEIMEHETQDSPTLPRTAYRVENGADFVVHKGNITRDKQQDEYSFTPPRDGTYRFEFSGMYAQMKVNLYIRDAGGGLVALRKDGTGGSGSISDGQGLTTDKLNAGQRYTVQVEHRAGHTPYTLSIGCPKPTVDISAYSSLSDSIEFTGQQNNYSFTPAAAGTYRFEFSDMYAQTQVNLYIRDAGGGLVAFRNHGIGGVGSLSNGGSLSTDKLNAGQCYTVQVEHRAGHTPYTLNIGR